MEKIWLLIVEVVTSIAEQISADYDELMASAINGNKHLKMLFDPYLKVEPITLQAFENLIRLVIICCPESIAYHLAFEPFALGISTNLS